MLGVVPLPQRLDFEDAKDSDLYWPDIMHNSGKVSQGFIDGHSEGTGSSWHINSALWCPVSSKQMTCSISRKHSTALEPAVPCLSTTEHVGSNCTSCCCL